MEPSQHWMAESEAAYSPNTLDASLPHRTPEELSRISAGILGVATWQAVCAATGIDWASIAM